MSKQEDPSKPTPDKEKFKPSNVVDQQAASNGRGPGGPADTHGIDVARGSEPDTRGASGPRQ